MGSTTESTPYWHVNIPAAERTAACPDFLAALTDKDRGIIGTPDDQYHIDEWADVQRIVAANRLDLFRRVPSELRRYLAYTWALKREYGSVMDFMLAQRLHWEAPVVARGRPFELDDDLKILCNDWPYGIDRRIVHLVVWTKFALAESPETGDLTDAARAEVEAYVQRNFASRMPQDHVIWFKNWASLKSIRSVEHFHVMLFDPDPEFVREITNGDIPLSRRTGTGISPAVDLLPSPLNMP